ncbi:class I SAM-dependent methyltransferase [Amycolatopsis magusensis]|uniref:class I SAM-dependent methyltransferase n=1 Tax=Amycolatopsis magusensis TaxID=882444 RepID=UPI0024A8914A|nr:class I SAM-dependent methyltransferase [Amycolatopsis magusensis]MDI5978834.1 class I SAM-dependent methyltransferase [Amycolatopsis magusensis]
MSWEWDPTLYAGSAEYYARGRIDYPAALAAEFELNGSGRLLDVGCGPGSLTLLLAGEVEEAVGIDADPDMIAEAERRAAGLSNTRWVCLRAEELPAGLGKFRLVTFAQSFHWTDRPRVAAIVRGMLAADGACAHLHAITHKGVATAVPLEHPSPPHAEITELVREYLGPVRRAGRSRLPHGTPGGESEIYRAAGFTMVRRIEMAGRVVTRDIDDLVASVYSLSSSTPHLFGELQPEFEVDLRELLWRSSFSGLFSERAADLAVDVWCP